MSRFTEKSRKLILYSKLEMMFNKKSEFSVIHPESVNLWKRKFRQMIRYSSDRTFPIAEEFLNARIEKISDRELNITDEKKPILICALKNDIQKMEYFMEHYRKLGIENFVFLDNNSTDGTFEFLLKQPDTIVYRCEHPFTANRKIAWLNRLIAECGINKWYLSVDSDEFLTYIGYTKNKIEDVVKEAESCDMKRIGCIFLDMYPKGPLFETDENVNFMEKYCYFDKDTHDFARTTNGMSIMGGPRARVFGIKMKLSRYILFYFQEDDVIPSAHYLMPLEKSYGMPVWFATLHYKFVNESDYEKMLEAVRTGMHSDNSREYRKYYEVLSENPDISLYDEKHSLSFSEEHLKEIPFLEEPFKNEANSI